jgi:isopentenyl-diphosphate delta-isomerase
MNDEQIVLLSAEGEAVGAAPKAASHHRNTPLHLAFSCYLVNEAGQVLITRRAPSKRTWPSVWTNSCCGHPMPGEGLRDAVRRRVRTELGADIESPILVLPGYRYRAQMADGLTEHEICPVVRAVTSGPVRLNLAEVTEAEWWSWASCLELADSAKASPWFRGQMAELAPMDHPLDWPPAAADRLPPAIAW